MKDETIKILENGIFIYNGKLLLYCVKNDNMTGIKNRALVLESLVNFYFRQLKIVPLPSLLINLNYKKSDKKIPNMILKKMFKRFLKKIK